MGQALTARKADAARQAIMRKIDAKQQFRVALFTIFCLRNFAGRKNMTRPDSLFEAASYDLNKFIERRMADRRSVPRNSLDRRQQASDRHANPNTAAGNADAKQSPQQ